ncbi:hypothetical protein CEUSTIGMA_g1938.t1 [Chlamydomonas eustigma]|uniref:Uncharacterized protein n=1 Tax=Chlamydomonas eustigma TaxID=1157962 RepID=A0A250WUV0_9CHLO|nr:hypothetical protein CEUSTIGMA_g1938.t1 [Chlamydomonas eustigma]|eukprot:GAX74489.1 hypothetical protein CEUSTIGMA_g1938.t1 [Chlamydomonas eustigma]
MLRYLSRRIAQVPVGRQQRNMGGNGEYLPPPKPDTSMDHVFGDNSYKVDFNFSPPPMFNVFALTIVSLAVFGFPAWLMVYEESKMDSFKAQLAAAKAAKGGA